jgi:hypothetical protein
MRLQLVIFPHPLDAWLRFFALSMKQRGKLSGVGKNQRSAAVVA